MGTYEDLISEIRNADKDESLQKLNLYINNLTEQTPKSFIPELNGMKKKLEWNVQHYTELYDDLIRKRDYDDNPALSTKWGDELRQKISTFNALLETVTFVLLTEGKDKKASMRQPKPPKPTKPFPQYFVERYREILPEVCKLVFNANNSQKDYAIMICLLHEKYLLSFVRADFYKSWYSFIDRQYSPKESFAAINNIFTETEINYVCDETDTRYLVLKRAFEKALKDNNIR